MLCYRRVVTTLLLFFLLAASSIYGVLLELEKNPDVKEVWYTHFENYRALVAFPSGKGKRAVVIYNYDEIYERAGYVRSVELGYDPVLFLRYLARQGVIAIMPLYRHRQVNAVTGAIQYAKTLPQADERRIFIMGHSEGATLSLLALKDEKNIAGVIILSPATIHDWGNLSVNQLEEILSGKRIPMLYLLAGRDKIRYLLAASDIYHVLRKTNQPVDFKRFPFSRDWFWEPDHFFMDNVLSFIRKHHL